MRNELERALATLHKVVADGGELIECPPCGHEFVDYRTSDTTSETGDDDLDEDSDDDEGAGMEDRRALLARAIRKAAKARKAQINAEDSKLTPVQRALKSRGFNPFGKD